MHDRIYENISFTAFSAVRGALEFLVYMMAVIIVCIIGYS